MEKYWLFNKEFYIRKLSYNSYYIPFYDGGFNYYFCNSSKEIQNKIMYLLDKSSYEVLYFGDPVFRFVEDLKFFYNALQKEFELKNDRFIYKSYIEDQFSNAIF